MLANAALMERSEGRPELAIHAYNVSQQRFIASPRKRKRNSFQEEVKAPSQRLAFMPDSPHDDSFSAALRAKLRSAQLDSGRSLEDLSEALELPPATLRGYLQGDGEITVSQLYRFGQLVGRPIWWFFGEQPATVSIEAAETALGNIARLRLYVDALESEFRKVLGPQDRPAPARRSVAERPSGLQSTVVVDFAPYLSRARAILEREAEFTEDSEEVFEESVEMIAHSLYSIEMAQVPPRETPPS